MRIGHCSNCRNCPISTIKEVKLSQLPRLYHREDFPESLQYLFPIGFLLQKKGRRSYDRCQCQWQSCNPAVHWPVRDCRAVFSFRKSWDQRLRPKSVLCDFGLLFGPNG